MTPKLSPDERRKLVALGVKVRKSNRAIAKELDVDEGTVRRDRKLLANPASERPIKEPWPEKLQKAVPAFDPTSSAGLDLQLQRMHKTVKSWIAEEGLSLPNIEIVIDQAARLLYFERQSIPDFPIPIMKPAEVLHATRPRYAGEEYLPIKLSFYSHWLARWLACCLPGMDERWSEFLHDMSIRARSQ
jgi:transposase-like protein